MNRLLTRTVKVVISSPHKVVKRGCTTKTSTVSQKAPSQSVPDVPGLSKNTVNVSLSEVGPGASKSGTYKNPEYFSYHNASYFEAEVEMKKYRCPQPSALKK